MGRGNLVDQNCHTGEEEGAGGCLDKRLYSAWAEERGKVSCKCPLLLPTSHGVTMEEHFGCMHALYCYGPLNLVKHTTNLKLKLPRPETSKAQTVADSTEGPEWMFHLPTSDLSGVAFSFVGSFHSLGTSAKKAWALKLTNLVSGGSRMSILVCSEDWHVPHVVSTNLELTSEKKLGQDMDMIYTVQ